jgi:hypothetical protein
VTGNPHTPIYTRRDLAELVAEHDREHPDHSDNCDCENGLISMLRVYFAPTEPIITDEPAPYIPPDTRPPQTENPSKRKPWLNQREAETQAEYNHRTSHSCYNCGQYISDREELNEHEDNCSQQGRRAQ